MNLRFLTLVVGLAAGLVGHTASAQVLAPSQGGEVNVVSVTATTIEVSFGRSGNGQGRVIGMAVAGPNGRPVSLAATDGQFYAASNAFSQGSPLSKGYAVYNGDGHSVTITNLQPNTYYYFTDSEYNTDGVNIIYNGHGNGMSTATRNTLPLSPQPLPSPLPVELITFTGTVDAHSRALLQWFTASERNATYFALERSIDGTTFAETGQVAAVGNSTQRHAYQWPDPQLLTQLTYYRLRQVDRDGTVSYSSVINLSPRPRVARQLEVYPNPSAGQDIHLLLHGFDGENLTLRLADALGRPVATQLLTPIESHYLAPLSLSHGLAAGTYFLTLAGSGRPVQKRIVVSD